MGTLPARADIKRKKKGKTARNDASHDVATATDESGFPISCQKIGLHMATFDMIQQWLNSSF